MAQDKKGKGKAKSQDVTRQYDDKDHAKRIRRAQILPRQRVTSEIDLFSHLAQDVVETSYTAPLGLGTLPDPCLLHGRQVAKVDGTELGAGARTYGQMLGTGQIDSPSAQVTAFAQSLLLNLSTLELRRAQSKEEASEARTLLNRADKERRNSTLGDKQVRVDTTAMPWDRACLVQLNVISQYTRDCHAPLPIATGNFIRSVKSMISQVQAQAPRLSLNEEGCFKALKGGVERYLDRHVFAAGRDIAATAAARIVPGDTLLLYGNSRMVERACLIAWQSLSLTHLQPFSVVVVDSRPQDLRIAKTLVQAGISVSYCMLSGLHHVMASVSKVITGTFAVLGSGAVMSRAGTALICSMAKERHIPVLCLAETFKFTDRACSDSLAFNEVGDPAVIAHIPTRIGIIQDVAVAPKANTIVSEDENAPTHEAPLAETTDDLWARPNVSIANIRHDLTPPDHVNVLVTENGEVPPSSARYIWGSLAGQDYIDWRTFGGRET
ncbi:initiation factor 2B-related [Kipferlia bialata]|uniref:Translation initiation factor eIF2B subunit delta n=1 Tax=Kipferlia bialata TaxID=797122 RepID=A0A9K3CR77_9EUKA|nr:initiation factor 2B-related [Kipferlia bialata]|eukprot:g2805.t1